ncbi:AMP-binding protein [Pseudonocardia sp. KRD-184]|uniref:AMP-binding protein n=1 Tax=Pseudonocardia oceani TaxID=2792013 RepID=A0ABS6UGI6_9PSEU|nr:AMP-binding protein [Pseudonocardia oceani]MBW0089244.1 AMP-binding protein [Pseudonocardia oceani]MBW0095927.1 AMP-binding protein [Pseudonocardia oceani]MBW0108912.1 AMP-binding protein [Pseudonocardia oceani]MBW0122696.1 AMP-binding protein [Pseudonocardia oceani]MBW0131329.1 AMP-binding protein [Pseudonocardia oceani]
MPSPVRDHTVPWPSDVVEDYVARGFWLGVPLGSALRQVADGHPEAPALVDVAAGVRLAHGELADRADAAAARLLDLGMAPGERIVVQLGNGWEFVVLTLACLRAGIVPVMALPAHRRTELAHLARHAEATAIAVPDRLRDFDHQAFAHELADDVREATGGPWHVLVAGDDVAPGSVDLRALCGPGDPAADRARLDALAPGSRDVAVFLLSGGTTGLPKLIARTHDDYAYNARRSAEMAGVDAGTVYLVSLPAGHNFPLACPGILGTLLAGGVVVTLPSPEPVRAFAAIRDEGVTHTAVVPAVAGRWLDHAAEHGAPAPLRVLQVGGARLADELARRVAPVLGCRLQQVFGMAEGLLNYTRLDDPDDVVCTTQGRPMSPADEVRLVDELDRDVPEGEPGSLLTRGPYTPRGYYRAAEQNARAFTDDGWYRSGDICRRTPEGNLVVEGRDKDMINRGGEKISAEEVENLVHQLPAVAQVAAVAMPDPQLGERVCLYVVPRPGATVTLEEIRDAMDAVGVARFKLPEHLVLVDELAATKVGKIDKKALRADIAERLSGTPA